MQKRPLIKKLFDWFDEGYVKIVSFIIGGGFAVAGVWLIYNIILIYCNDCWPVAPLPGGE